MSQFFKRFLTEEAARLNPGAQRFLALGAFGKHPGWDDHIEDLGLETDSLALAKRVLYVQGVGGQIDTGAWEKLDPEQRLEGFNHIFVWQRAGQLLLGKLWSSRDGKGRARYPMVLCAHCLGTSLAWALQVVLPCLESLEKSCKAAATAAEVRSLLESARAQLRGRLLSAESETELTALPNEPLRRFVADPVFGPDQQGWLRILYQLDSQMAPYAIGSFSIKGELGSLRPQQSRLPTGNQPPEQSLAIWRRFFATRIDRAVPLLLVLSPGQNWVDGIVGEPTTQEFFCLRARPGVLPLATEVPYELSEAFKGKARTFLADLQSGNLATLAAPSSAPEPAPGAWASITQRWFKRSKLWLVLGLGVALVASVALLVLEQGPHPQPPPPQVVAGNPGPIQAKVSKAIAPSTAPSVPPPTAPTASQTLTGTGGPVSNAAPAAAEPAGGAQPAPAREPQVQLSTVATNPSSAVVQPQASVTISPAVGQTEQSNLAARAGTELAALIESNSPTTAARGIAASTASPASAISLVLTNSIGLVLAWIAGLPGCGEGGYVSKYEITQAQFEGIMGSNPSQSKNALQPVESVTWDEAVEFCRKLTALEQSKTGVRLTLTYALPSEAQWEYFLADARFEDAVTSRSTLHDSPAPVGSLAPNKYGLYDVLGNVWEFCSDVPNTSERLLHGAGFNNRKLFGETAAQWKPLQPATPRRLGLQERSADAGFRCIAKVQ